MLLIKQSNHDIGNLQLLINRYGSTELYLNQSLINSDIAKLEALREKQTFNSSDKKNIDGIIDYLKKLKSKIGVNGEYQMTWQFKNWKLYGYPLDIRHFEAYNVKASDYIILNKYNMIRLNYRKLFELIAFEMMHRDLGYESSDIEEMLKNIGILAISDSNIFNEIIKTDEPLSMSKIYRIGNSIYATADGKLSYDYFGTIAEEDKSFKSGYYKDCVERSVDIAICILTKSIIDALALNKIRFQICSLNEDGLYFMVDNTKNLEMSKIFESVAVRVFGRKFEVKPEIEIF